MKLTKNQKELLKRIENKNIRKEVKKEFKRKISLYRTNWKTLESLTFKDGELKTDNPTVTDFLSQHPMNGILFKDNVEKTFSEGYPWYVTNSKEVEGKFNKLASEFMPKEKYTPKNPLSTDQIETVINWMNTWEQLKGTVIPIRFKEDFINKNFDFKGFDAKNYRSSLEDKFSTHDCANHIPEKNHLCWIYNRLLNYGENPNFDYMHKLKEISLNFSTEKQFTLEDMRKAYFTAVIDYLKTDNGKHEYNGGFLFNKFIESLKKS